MDTLQSRYLEAIQKLKIMATTAILEGELDKAFKIAQMIETMRNW